MNSHLLPRDADYHDDKVLMGELSALTTQVSRYVLHYFNVDAGTAAPLGVDLERVLGEHLATLADKVPARADRRAPQGDRPPAIEPAANDDRSRSGDGC